MKHNFLIATMLLAAATASAVKMRPGQTTIKQSDGTTLTVKAYGDADFSYFTTTDGTLLYQQGFDFYVAEVADDGSLRPTAILAHEPRLRSKVETASANAQDRHLFYNSVGTTATANKMRREPMAENSTLLPHTGSPRVPVILVEFSDSTFKVADPKSVFNKYLNAEQLFDKSVDTEMGNNYGSVKRYFTDMSFGTFTPQFDVYGPVQLGQPLKKYGAGYSSSEDMTSLLTDACTAADADIDFSQYDANGDGYIDLVYVIYAGYSASITGNSTDCIHPKSGTLSIQTKFDGKRIMRYGVNNEINGTPADQAGGLLINGIGLFCHEFSHCMGLPDLYPSSGSVAERCINQNMDYWDLMDAGEYTYNGYRPTEYTAWERERFGWMTIDTLTAAADITLSSLSRGGKAYRILNDNDNTGHEYYIVENVQKEGWNKSVLGHGMLVSHVDYDDNAFTVGGNRVNNTAGHPRMTIIAADGMFVPEYFTNTTIKESSNDTEKGINATLYDKYLGQEMTQAMYKAEQKGDPFPGTANVDKLTDDSSPASAWVYTGGYMGKPITNIVEDSETGDVSFSFMGGLTAIKEVETDKTTTDKQIYSIDGRRLGTDKNSLGKGIYIIGGKKVVL